MQLDDLRRVIGAKHVLVAGRSRRPSGVKCDPSCTRGGQAKHETEDKDGMLSLVAGFRVVLSNVGLIFR